MAAPPAKPGPPGVDGEELKRLIALGAGTLKKLPPSQRLFDSRLSPSAVASSPLSSSGFGALGGGASGGLRAPTPQEASPPASRESRRASPKRDIRSSGSSRAAAGGGAQKASLNRGFSPGGTASSCMSLSGGGNHFDGGGGGGGSGRPDPFTDWKSTVMDKNKMSLTQLKMQSFEGQREVATELKHMSQIFKHVDLKALEQLSDDRLHDNRTFYSTSGMYTTKIGQQREDAWKRKYRPPTKHAQQKEQEGRELFNYYNVSLPRGRSTPNLKDLRRLLNTSHETSELAQEAKAEAQRQQLLQQQQLQQ